MPIYVYEAKDPKRACAKCKAGFDVVQSLKDAKLTACPHCGAEVFRVVQAPGLAHSKSDLHYRAKRAGFHTLKKVTTGEYEKIY